MNDSLHVATGEKPVWGKLLPYVLLFLASFLFTTKTFPQAENSITGTVILADGNPLEYASVALQNGEGKAIKGTLTDSLGKFKFSAMAHGSYRIHISSMGFISHHSQVFNLSEQRSGIHFGQLKLLEDIQTLDGITISVRKNVIEQSMDKMTINVENSILSEGNTALELLQRAPGVKVDEDGKISLKGRPGVTVMINGKLTFLSPAELAVLLKGTNSSSISKIEIMDNPSAKYDAAGNAGVVNIVMKKNQGKGLNGSVAINGGAGRKARYGSGFTLNYKNRWFNVYGSYNYAYRGETEYLDFSRRFYDNGQINGNYNRISNQHTKTNEPLNTNNFRLGADFDINKSSSIGVLVNGNVGKYLHDSKTSNQLSAFDGRLISHLKTTNYDKQGWENITYNLNYQHKFNKEGKEFTADVDYANNSFTSDLNLDTYTSAMTGNQNEVFTSRKGYVPAKTDVYVAKADYADRWGKALKFQTGLKSSIITSDNNLVYQNLNQGIYEYDASSSNYFIYKEQIHAAYLNFGQEFKSFSVQLGLRGEYTNTVGNQVTSNQTFKRNYFQLFPNIAIAKSFRDNNQLQFAMSRRVQRPDYSDLNPFRVFRDPLLYYEGNPNLRPEVTQNFVISHVFKGKYTSALNYSKTKDVMTWITGQIDAINTTFESPQNLKNLINYGFSFTGQTDYFKWWSATNFFNVYRNEYNGEGEIGVFSNSMTSFSFNSQNSFKAGKGYSFELNGYLNSKSVYGTGIEKAYYVISIAGQKSLLKDKANVKLLLNDVFQSSQFRKITRYQNIDMNSHVNVDGRRLILSFSYRFGNPFAVKEKKTGNDDIQNRVKGNF